MKLFNYFLVLTLLIVTFSGNAQNFNMSNTTITSCSGTFFDSGGNGFYSNNQNLTFTICPGAPGSQATVDFTVFDIENNFDNLTIYDGNSTGAPSLGTFTGTNSPGFVSATTGNASGCLTFFFSSDFSVTDIGWVANIGCTQPCQDVIANANFSPLPDGDGVIRLCQGESLSMNGSGTYPNNNVDYTQSDITSSFEWFVDGTTLTGQNVSYSFPNGGAYYINLNITDVQGCSNSNSVSQLVYVSTTPIFAGTSAAPDPICLGEQAAFTGVVNTVTFEQECNQPNFPPIPLPDGSGVSYEESVNLDCFGPGQQLTNINDFLSLCVNMEHSYMGDLDIEIECPSGQSVLVVDFPNGGGGTYLGIPVDNDLQPNNQGTGFQYCWDPNATNGTWGDNSGGTLPSGTYESDNPLSGLVGCDLNGNWTLTITDNLGSDNGFIFDWSLNFAPGLAPPPVAFTPTIVSEIWQSDPTIVGGTNPITVEPTSVGSNCYTYEVTDNFGCSYDTTICITVNPSPVIDPIADITDCNPVTLPTITGTDLTGNQAFYTGPNGTGTQFNPGDVISTTTTLYIYDEQVVAPFCSDEEVFNIIIANPILTLNCPGTLTAVCDISEQPAYGSYADFQTGGGSASTTAGATILPGTFTLVSEVSDNNSCPETVTRTYQIEDDCGNIETCSQTIIIDDNINPTGTAPLAVTVQCTGDIPAINTGAVTGVSDNCTVNPTVTHLNDVSDGNTCPEVITRTYEITDNCGNSTTVTQTITVDDTQNPTASNPAPINTTGSAPPPNVTVVDDEADNCTLNPTVAFVGDVSDGLNCPETVTRTYSVTDDCGNETLVQQIITIGDAINPTASNPAPISVQCSGDVPASDPAVVTDEADNGALPTVTWENDVSDGNSCPEIITRTYRVTDDCGNFIFVEQTITINDDTNPVATAPVDVTVQCTGDIPAINTGAVTGVSDNCTANPTVTHVSDASDGNTCPEVITRTYEIADDCGNTITVTQTITIDDTQAPLATAPASVTVQCTGDIPAINTGAVTGVSDNCTANPTVTHVSDASDGNTCPEVITRTYEIADDCGNTTTVTQTITVDDTQSPTASNPAPISASGSAPAPNVTVVDDEADNCTLNPTVAFVGDVSDGLNCPETVTRTYSVTDDCGNETLVQQIITIGDAINPTASNPAPISVQCTGDVPASDPAVVTDEADNGALPTVTWENDVSDGNSCPEIITRTYRVTDDCGNFIFVEQTITINDDTNPVATAPVDVTVQCTGDIPAINTGAVTGVSDNCTVNPTVTHVSDASDGNTCPEVITRTYEIADDCGNTITVTQTITIDDTQAPLATAPASVTVQCTGDIPAINTGAVTGVSDNCTANPTVSHVSDASDGNTCPEVITRTYEIADDCGNTTTVTQTITIDDTQAPLATAPADVTVQCIGDAPAIDINSLNGVSDNCTANPTVTHIGDVNSGVTCPFDITRTYRVEDECGNFIEVDQIITVNDNINPTGTAPASLSVQCVGDIPAADIALITDAADNCTVNPVVTHVGDVSDGNTCPQVITRTYRIEDECGNFIEVDQIITIDDDINPTGTAPAPVTVQCIGDVPIIDITVITDEADNCTANPAVTHVGDVSDGNTCPEVITRTYRIEDACGNFIEVDQIITVNDDIAPTASNPAITTVDCSTDVPAVDPAVVTDEADNCTAAPTVTFISETSDNNVCNGEELTRTYEIADDCGNTTTVTHTIVIDSYTPTFTVIGTDPSLCGALDGFITISGLDPNTGYSFSYDSGATIGITSDGAGQYVISGLGAGSYTGFTVSDADCPACSTTDNVTITLTDPNPPAIDAGLDQEVCEGSTVTLTANNPDGATITWNNGVTDGVPFTPAVGTATYTVTADLAGCINSDVVSVTVAPTIDALTCPGGLTAVCDISEQPAYNDFFAFLSDGGSATIPVGGEIDTTSFVLLNEVSDGNTCPETVTRTYQIADTCGVTATCTQTIVINDLIAPTGTAPAPVTVQCIGDVPVEDPALITDAADNCSVPTVTHVGDVSDGNSCPEVITRTYRIEDDCGNFIEVDQIITIDDDINPTGTAPAPVTVQCIGDVPIIDITVITDEADNCTANPAVTHVGDVSDGNTCPEVITRTYRIEDACGNFIEVDQIITVNDDIAPTASNPAITTVDCSTDVPAVDPAVVTDEADNCTAAPTVTFISETSDNNVCNGEELTRTYEIADDCGNTTTVTHTIVIDSYTPTFTVIGTDPSLCGALDGFITISGLDPNTGYSFSYDSGATIGITSDGAGQYVISGLGAGSYTGFTVSDADCPACSTTDNVTITLTDPNPPAIDAGLDQEVCEGSTVTLTANNPDGATITWNNGVTDGVPFTPAVGTATYTVTADLAGCVSTDQVVVTVAPTIDALTCPGGLTAVCDISEQPAYNDFFAFLSDGGSATIPVGGEIDTTSFVLLNEVSDGNTCPETVTRTYQIADTCGVTATCTQTIVINDLIAPTGTAPAPVTVQCIGDVPVEDPALITDAADNCSVPTVTHVGDVSDGNSCPEVITRTYRIEDDCGNFIEVDQIITIDDDINPTGTAPAPVTVQCIGDVPIIDITVITDEADNCTTNPAVTHVGDVSDGNTCPEVITRTYRIEDACGNFIEVDQIITVNDDIAPTASNPAITTVDCSTDVPAVDPAVVTDEADNCTAAPTVTFISETSDNNVCNGEELTRTYEIADDCGNTTTVTHTIVIDSYTPTFTVVGTDPTQCGVTDGFITVSGLDPNTSYAISYNGNATQNVTTDGNGEYVITGLGAGAYTDFTIAPTSCTLCEATNGIVNLEDPNAPMLDAGADQVVCEGSSVTLTADNPDGANISWDNGVTDGTSFTPGLGTLNYTVTANLLGCISTDVVSVTVNPIPSVDAGNDIQVCEGEQVILSGSGADSYVWNNGVSNGVPFSPSATTTYTVTGNTLGCEETDEITVVVNGTGTVDFEADVLVGCIPLTTTFTNLSSETDNVCVWTLGDGTVINDCSGFTHTYSSAGCFDVTLTVTSPEGCVSSETFTNYICVDDFPIAEFTANPTVVTTTNPLVEFVNGSIGATDYEWSFGDGASSTDVNTSHDFPDLADEIYEVELVAISEYGCTDTVVSFIEVREDLIFYVPNTFTPDGNIYNETFQPVFTSGFDPFDYNLLIFNRWGEVVFESNNAAVGWDGTYGSSAEPVKDGVYIWKIEFKTKYTDERKIHTGHVNVLK